MTGVKATKWWRAMILKLVIITILGFAIFGPLAGTLLWSFAIKWYWPSALPQEFGLKYWANALTGRSQVLDALWLSISIALIVVAVGLLVSIPAGYALARFDVPWKKVLLVLFLMPQAFPQLPVFINMSSIFYRLNIAGTVAGVTAAHLVVSLVYSVWITTATFKSIPEVLEDAAINLGASRVGAFFKITLPLAAPGLIASAIFVFLNSLDEFTGTFFVGAPYIQTLPILMYTASMGYNMQAASVIAIMLTIPSLVFMAILERFLKAEYIRGLGV
ncbi:MAG TPA: ABC transporter permease subunit [Firmicutes bacterium]|nr:ABC transporter permease subunit [Bacillota bacterium]